MHRIERRFPGMAKRRVSEIVAKRNGFGQILIQIQRPRVCASGGSGNDRPAQRETPVFCLSSCERLWSGESGPGLSGRRCGCHTPVHIGPFLWNSGCAPHKDSAPEIPVLQTILSSSNEDHLFPGNMPVTVLFIVLLFPIFGARFRFPFLFFKFFKFFQKKC